MEQLISFVAFVVGCLSIWTWAVIHQAATEARGYFRRQNTMGSHRRSGGRHCDRW